MKTITILLALTLLSCDPCKFVSKHSECFPTDSSSTSKFNSEIDSSGVQGVDSTWMQLYFMCDSNNEVLLKEFQEVKTAASSSETNFNDNKLTVLTKTPVEIKYKTITEKEKEYIEVINPVNPLLKENNEKLNKKVANLTKQRNFLLIWFITTCLLIVLVLYLKFK